MPANGRAPSFQFYPRDFSSDPAVRMMTPEARGGYIMLLCAAWSSDEPGVLRESDCRALSEIPDGRWDEVGPQIARAFDTTSRKGYWLQKRMMSERKAQERRYQQARKGALTTNRARWG